MSNELQNQDFLTMELAKLAPFETQIEELKEKYSNVKVDNPGDKERKSMKNELQNQDFVTTELAKLVPFETQIEELKKSTVTLKLIIQETKKIMIFPEKGTGKLFP